MYHYPGGGGGTRYIPGWGGTARSLIPWTCLRQISQIFPPCLRQNSRHVVTSWLTFLLCNNAKVNGSQYQGNSLEIVPLSNFFWNLAWLTFMIWTLKKCNKNVGHRVHLHVSGLLKWGIFTGYKFESTSYRVKSWFSERHKVLSWK